MPCSPRSAACWIRCTRISRAKRRAPKREANVRWPTSTEAAGDPMNLQPRPLTVDLSRLDGLSERLVASHHENNYAGAVKRLNAIRQQLSQLDWARTPVFLVN